MGSSPDANTLAGVLNSFHTEKEVRIMHGQYNTKKKTIVIGGGQAGLSVGYYLKKYGVPFRILDANPRVGDAWRNRWD